MCMNAEKIGLMVITLERYFKIEYPGAYQKYWMTPVAVAIPWISGFCTFIIPAVLSTKAIPGACPRLGFWPNKHDMTVSCVFFKIIFDTA